MIFIAVRNKRSEQSTLKPGVILIVATGYVMAFGPFLILGQIASQLKQVIPELIYDLSTANVTCYYKYRTSEYKK